MTKTADELQEELDGVVDVRPADTYPAHLRPPGVGGERIFTHVGITADDHVVWVTREGFRFRPGLLLEHCREREDADPAGFIQGWYEKRKAEAGLT